MGNTEFSKSSSCLLIIREYSCSIYKDKREPASSEVYCPVSSPLNLLNKVTLEAMWKNELLNVVDSATL